ncbi:MAG: hypothetical protein KIS67_22660 [Verrucomicrobiae bacterium]|nr:hypothetical protein [Verrucomicrobiae bacterium]
MKLLPPLGLAGVLLAALLPSGAQAQLIELSSTWIQHDPQEVENVQPNGLLDLINQSAGGFTATVRANEYAPEYPARSQYLPRIVQTFADQPVTNAGSRVTVAFDVVFHTLAPENVDVGFRISLGDTNANNAILGGFEFGTPSGQVVLLRYDTTITQDTNYLDLVTGNYVFGGPYAWSSICDGGGNMGSTSTAPNGAAMGTDTTTTHHIRFSVERVPTSAGGLGLQVDAVWSNSAGDEVSGAAGAPIPGGNGDDFNGLTNVLPWTNINCFALCLFGTAGRQPFLEGSYTVSNFEAYYGFKITDFLKDGSDEVITWESTPVDVCQYIVESSSNLSIWSPISTNLTEGFTTSFTNSAPVAADARYYRVVKQF